MMAKYWVTKWWQAKGALAVDGEVKDWGDGVRAVYVGKLMSEPGYGSHVIGRDAFPTLAEAQARIAVLARKRLDVLSRERARVEGVLAAAEAAAGHANGKDGQAGGAEV